MTWFDKKFNTLYWWERRLILVAKSLGLVLSRVGNNIAHAPYVKKHFGNWRCSPMWFRHLEYLEKENPAWEVNCKQNFS